MPAITDPVQRAQDVLNADPDMGTGAFLKAAHGVIDDGYADWDNTSRWIERIETLHA